MTNETPKETQVENKIIPAEAGAAPVAAQVAQPQAAQEAQETQAVKADTPVVAAPVVPADPAAQVAPVAQAAVVQDADPKADPKAKPKKGSGKGKAKAKPKAAAKPKPKKVKKEKPAKVKKPRGNEPKSFELLDTKSGDVISTYTNKQPRGAALKAAAEGHLDILLREAGSNTEKRVAVLHRFKGERKQVPWALPYNAYALKKVEELSGKPVPPELNVKDGRKALQAAGFKDYLFWKPNVKKVQRLDVPKVQGKSLTENVQEFVRALKA